MIFTRIDIVNIRDIDGELIWAHRGHNRLAPENTMAAFRLSMDAGDSGIELDITLSSDGEMVVIHDDSVDRTTNGTGLVADTGYAELRRLNAGSWFGPGFEKEHLPVLSEVLNEVRGRMLVNIEIKTSAWRESAGDCIEARLLKAVKDAEMEDSVLVSGFDWRSLRRLRESHKKIAIGLLADRGWDPDQVAVIAEELDAYSIHPNLLDIVDRMPESFRRFNGKIYPYTVKDTETGARVLKAGADGYFADLPF